MEEVTIDVFYDMHPWECGSNCRHCNKLDEYKHNPDYCAQCYEDVGVTPDQITSVVLSNINLLTNRKNSIGKKIIEECLTT